MAESTIEMPEGQPDPGFILRIFHSAWQVLQLDEDAYGWLLEVEHPLRRGLGVITVILVSVSLASSLGLLFDYLTMPRAYMIQERIFEAITNWKIFEIWARYHPFLAKVFNTLYNITWFMIRQSRSYPSRLDIFSLFVAMLTFGIFDWITYAWIAQIVARRLGGQARRGIFYAPMALAYAPKLLLLGNIVPGLVVPTSLVRAWTLATSYQAARATFKLSWGRSLLIVILPYFITTALFIIALVLGVTLGVAVSSMIT